MATIISKTDLARKTREIVEQARRGKTIIVESYGEEQIVLLDALDYRILKAAADRQGDDQHPVAVAIRDYLDESISLSKTAEMISISRFDLLERLERLGLPLRQGSASLEEAQAEVDSARRFASSS